MKYDLHVHSKYSLDSFLSLKTILQIAKKRGLDGIALTDHDTIKGGVEAIKANGDPNFQVIVGAEIKTEYGDIIGLFLSEEIKSRKFENVIEEIKYQGGSSVLAHPYRQHKSPEKLAESVDFIEGFNARSKVWHNEKAYELAVRLKKPMTAGSDAHFGFELGRGIKSVNTHISDVSKMENDAIEGIESPYHLAHGMSIVVKKFKRVI